MGHADFLRNGDWNGICDKCGKKFKFSDLKLEWDGLYVCTANGCWEPRQPQDYLRGIPDNMSVPISRPGGGNLFLDTIWWEIYPVASIIKNIGKPLTALCSSICGLAQSYTYRGFQTKTVDGSAINRRTLG